mmetsp:Transcript_70796/g.166125  ORF Transcript_70796/g.166125 Transcript_70796/m.166125 type:complete len:242 (+) Transcript_70796:1703-2428(+)
MTSEDAICVTAPAQPASNCSASLREEVEFTAMEQEIAASARNPPADINPAMASSMLIEHKISVKSISFFTKIPSWPVRLPKEDPRFVSQVSMDDLTLADALAMNSAAARVVRMHLARCRFRYFFLFTFGAASLLRASVSCCVFAATSKAARPALATMSCAAPASTTCNFRSSGPVRLPAQATGGSPSIEVIVTQPEAWCAHTLIPATASATPETAKRRLARFHPAKARRACLGAVASSSLS